MLVLRVLSDDGNPNGEYFLDLIDYPFDRHEFARPPALDEVTVQGLQGAMRYLCSLEDRRQIYVEPHPSINNKLLRNQENLIRRIADIRNKIISCKRATGESHASGSTLQSQSHYKGKSRRL